MAYCTHLSRIAPWAANLRAQCSPMEVTSPGFASGYGTLNGRAKARTVRAWAYPHARNLRRRPFVRLRGRAREAGAYVSAFSPPPLPPPASCVCSCAAARVRVQMSLDRLLLGGIHTDPELGRSGACGTRKAAYGGRVLVLCNAAA